MVLRKEVSARNPSRHNVDTLPAHAKYPMTPLDFWLAILNDDSQPMKRRAEMAKLAARYVHQPIAAQKLPPKTDPPTWDLTPLSEEEFITLENLLIKIQRPAMV